MYFLYLVLATARADSGFPFFCVLHNNPGFSYTCVNFIGQRVPTTTIVAYFMAVSATGAMCAASATPPSSNWTAILYCYGIHLHRRLVPHSI